MSANLCGLNIVREFQHWSEGRAKAAFKIPGNESYTCGSDENGLFWRSVDDLEFARGNLKAEYQKRAAGELPRDFERFAFLSVQISEYDRALEKAPAL